MRRRWRKIEREFHVRAFGEELARINFLPEKRRKAAVAEMIDYARSKGVKLGRPALGVTQTLPKEDRLSWYKPAVLARIAMAMGGRIAEELKFGVMSSGAKNDIEQATALARSMVCEWGMSEKMGPVSFGEEQGEVFLGREFNQRQRNFSEATAIDIDSEVRLIVTTQYSRAKQLLLENKDALDTSPWRCSNGRRWTAPTSSCSSAARS